MGEWEDCDRVAAELATKLGDEDWWRGVAVCANDCVGCFVSVRIAFGVDVPDLPSEIDGVTIFVERRDLAKGSNVV